MQPVCFLFHTDLDCLALGYEMGQLRIGRQVGHRIPRLGRLSVMVLDTDLWLEARL